MCKTLFIDLDDTIWDFQANSKLSLRQVYDEFSLGRAFTGYEQFEKLYMTANHELWEEYHHNRVTKDFLIVERFARPFREAGSALSGDMDFIMALNHRYLDVLAQQKTLVPGAIDLLDYLTAKGYPLYILSNGFEQYYVFQNPMVVDKLEDFDTYIYRMGIINSQYSYATAMGMFKSIISILLLTIANGVSKKVRGESIF